MKHISTEAKKQWFKDINNLIESSQSIKLNNEMIYGSAEIAKKHINSELKSIKESLNNGLGFSVIRGCPIDDYLICIPTDEFRPENKSHISELTLLGITHALGFSPFSFKQEKSGEIVHEISPIKGRESSVSSNGVVDFDLHSDCAYLNREIRPETLSLICLNNDAKTDTNLVSIQTILNDLDSETVKILSSPEFIHLPPETFKVKNTINYSSILDRIDGNWELKVATHSCQPKTDRASVALKKFIYSANKNKVSHAWRPGDFLIFNNHKCLHGRGAIASGTRWLQRCYGSSRLNAGTVINLES
jgi:L-asparagine oxygenase